MKAGPECDENTLMPRRDELHLVHLMNDKFLECIRSVADTLIGSYAYQHSQWLGRLLCFTNIIIHKFTYQQPVICVLPM